MNQQLIPSSRGRPREFCVEAALAAALKVFWSKGYEGASLTDLTEAMGITRPSLYAAFGNKEALFHKALDLYGRDKLAYISAALEAPTARAVVERTLNGILELQAEASNPKGCLGVISSVACGSEAEGVRAEVLKRRKAADDAILARMERAKAEGDLPEHLSAEAVVGYISAIIQGLCLQAGAGASIEQLRRTVDMTLMLWPGR